MTTGRELYEEIWMKVRFTLNYTNSAEYQDRTFLWWTNYYESKGNSNVKDKE